MRAPTTLLPGEVLLRFMCSIFCQVRGGSSVPLLSGGDADGDTFVGLFTSGMNVIPSWEHLFHGSAKK